MTRETIDQALKTAAAYQAAGRLADAQKICRQVLDLDPHNAGALHLMGVLAGQANRLDESIEFLSRAIQARPDFAQGHYNLGLALQHAGRFDEAISAYNRGVQLKPDYAMAFNNIGVLMNRAGRWDEAIVALQNAIRLNPNFAEAHNNIGTTYRQLGRFGESVECFRRAIALDPKIHDSFNNLGNALKMLGKLDEAAAALRRGIEIKPDFPVAFLSLGTVLFDKGEIDAAMNAYRQAPRLKPDYIGARSNIVYSASFHPEYDAGKIFLESKAWADAYEKPLASLIKPHGNDPSPDRRLKIGYVSPDFRENVVGCNLLPLLEHHNHERFEIFCYSNVVRSDAVTESMRRCADRWHDIRDLSDDAAADLVRADQIDILVDLSLHMNDNRLLVFARKPAPVQVTYLGYCGTTGLSTIDNRFSDPYMDPPGTNLANYSEQTIRLPKTYWCYAPIPFAESGEIPSNRAGYITFGCLNNFAKVSPAALDCWSTILSQIPNSRLIIHAQDGDHRQRVRDLFASAGVNSDRIEFVGKLPRDQYARTYDRIDITLDPFPYGGGITTCDSLWMGVPVVTLSGGIAVGRGGVSILSNVGLRQFIAQTPEEYVEIALHLAADLPARTELRRTLRSRMLGSPLMDARQFALDVENAYRQMWKTWCVRRR
jgi:predicted O-linked N-acetylglucosamine transferase (SPINDLY family)